MRNKICISLFFILCLGFTRAQDFVSNGYFEVTDTCPTGGASTSPGYIYLSDATGWQVGTLSPDLYNSCSNNDNNVPYTVAGYQKDCCGGAGFAGIYVLDKNSHSNDDREYIYTKLVDTLKAGHKYLAKMYVNKSDGFDYAIATIGMLFTDTIVSLPWPQGFIQANPQVKNNTLLTDTVTWMLVQDTFTAIGNETYLTIGNFNTSATSDSVKVGGNGAFFGQAYYYIDGVSVIDVATIGIKQVKDEVKVDVYPNPNNGNMVVDYKLTDDATMEVIDMTGNLVCSYKLRADINTLNISNDRLSNGVYFYRMVKNNTIFKCQKLVIIK